jgi:hypothetical protein
MLFLGDLYDMLSTPSDTDFDSLLEMESNLFLDEIKKVSIQKVFFIIIFL